MGFHSDNNDMKHTSQNFEEMLDAAHATAEALADKNVKLRSFLLRLLNPEDLGHAVTGEVRDCARELLGMQRVESRP